MGQRARFASGVALMAAAAFSARANAAAATGPDEAADLAALQAVCGRCHSLQLVTSEPRSEEDWMRVFQKMADLGARGSDEQFDSIARVIRARLTIVDVNSASHDELVRLLQVSGAVADAIVERRARQRFRDLTDLESVPGVDAGQMEASRNRIHF